MATVVTTVFEIPLTPRAQFFQTEIAGTTYTLHFKYNRICRSWVMDVGDDTDIKIASGIPLVTGCDLMEQLRYLGIGGGVPMIAMSIGPGYSPDDVPTYENLGLDGHLFYKTY